MGVLFRFEEGIPLSGSIGSADIGRVGEYLVASVMEGVGVSASIVDRRGTDIFCRFPGGGQMFSLQVKTAPSPVSVGGMRLYQYSVKRKEADWYAFVALDTGYFRLREAEIVNNKGVNQYERPQDMDRDHLIGDLVTLFHYYREPLWF